MDQKPTSSVNQLISTKREKKQPVSKFTVLDILNEINNSSSESITSKPLDSKTPSQGHYMPGISSPLSSHPSNSIILLRANHDESNFKFIAIFTLSALLGASILLSETNLKRIFNECEFIIAILGLMWLAIFLYYVIQSHSNTQHRLNINQKNYIKLLVFESAGFILSYFVTQLIDPPPIFNQKIPKNASKWLYKTFHTDVSTVTISTIILAIVCFFIFALAYCKWHSSHSSIQKRSFFSRTENFCHMFWDATLNVLLLLFIVIPMSIAIYRASEVLIKGWINIPLSLIATIFWFAVVCMFFLHNEYHRPSDYFHNQPPQKKYLYFGGLTIVCLILPMLITITIICQAGNQACTIHNIISSIIIPMFIVFIIIGVYECIFFPKNRGYFDPLSDSLNNRNHQQEEQKNEIKVDITSMESQLHQPR